MHGVCESLDEGTASRGAGFVEHNGINRAVSDAEALDILPADVEDEVHIGLEELGGGVVRHGFNDAIVHTEGMAD